MNKLYLSKNLTFLGSLAIGAIAATSIATLPAQAVTIVGGIDFDADGLIDDDGGPPPDMVNLTNITDFADIFSAGIFDGIDLPAQIAVKDLKLTRDGLTDNYKNAAIDDFATYTGSDNYGDITFDLEAGATWIRSLDSLGGVIYSNVGGFDGTYTTTIDGGLGTTFDGAGALQFSESAGILGIAEIESTQEAATTPVPEPASILGLLVVSGLGLGLKCKKQL